MNHIKNYLYIYNMIISNFVRIGIVLYFSLCFVHSLKPVKLPSGQQRFYKYNRDNPELDLKNITPTEATFVSRHWLNNILEPNKICEEDKLIIEKINLLESFIQTQFTEHGEVNVRYLAWVPKGITTDVLFIIVMKSFESNDTLQILINSPFWDSNHIGTDCLLESLRHYSKKNGKDLNINDFMSENIRYRLAWKDIKEDAF